LELLQNILPNVGPVYTAKGKRKTFLSFAKVFFLFLLPKLGPSFHSKVDEQNV
jgi:hypothetical protein